MFTIILIRSAEGGGRSRQQIDSPQTRCLTCVLWRLLCGEGRSSGQSETQNTELQVLLLLQLVLVLVFIARLVLLLIVLDVHMDRIMTRPKMAKTEKKFSPLVLANSMVISVSRTGSPQLAARSPRSVTQGRLSQPHRVDSEGHLSQRHSRLSHTRSPHSNTRSPQSTTRSPQSTARSPQSTARSQASVNRTGSPQ